MKNKTKYKFVNIVFLINVFILSNTYNKKWTASIILFIFKSKSNHFKTVKTFPNFKCLKMIKMRKIQKIKIERYKQKIFLFIDKKFDTKKLKIESVIEVSGKALKVNI